MYSDNSLFKFHDCILMISPTGQRASNLKEFLSLLEESEDNVLYYHLYQSSIGHRLRHPEYPNDFANWSADALGDLPLAEKLANFDPYDFADMSDIKNSLTEIIEEHVWDLPTIPWARPGFEFYFCYSTMLVFPSEITAANLKEFKEALSKISKNSLYYHFFEARKKYGDKLKDDFSLWIEQNFGQEQMVKEIRDIDFYFYSMDEIREKLVKILNKY